MVFRLKLLGAVAIERDGVPLAGRSTQRRRLALLALLARARDRGMSRDKLLGLLWEERDVERARHALSQALYALRQELGEDALLTGIDEVRLNPRVLESDVETFETALAAGDLERAVATYGGSFLDGFFLDEAPEFERWSESERRRLTAAYGTALESLASAAQQRHEFDRAVSWWRRRAALDPGDSRVALGLMTALAAAGDRPGAIQHAQAHSTLLRDQLGVGPDPAVKHFAKRLRLEARPSDPVAPPPASEAAHARPTTVPPRNSRRRTLAATAAAGVILIVIGSLVWRSSVFVAVRAPVVVLGTIRSADTTLGLAVREALRAELEATPGLRVVPDAALRETLRLMRRSPDTAVTADVALEIAERRGATLVVTGSATPLGSGVQLVAQLLDARDGRTLSSLTERPSLPSDVIPAVSRLVGVLRRRATGVPVDTARQPLPAVTTASLPALRAYALARQALARGDRSSAITLLESAVQVHDSLFALAHYELGDLLWYQDQQRRSDQHLARALALSGRLPPRERLVIRARYEQIVNDRPDSALAYWELLRANYPDEPLAYEGMAWTYRALGRYVEAGVAADHALQFDPTSAPNIQVRLSGLLANDTTAALAFAHANADVAPWAVRTARLWIALNRRDFEDVLRIADSGEAGARAAYTRQVALLALGRLDDARAAMRQVLDDPWGQAAPRVLLLQARVAVESAARHRDGAALARRAVAWLERADLSPPAYARIAERAADVAARTGDVEIIVRIRRLLLQKDARRGLPSYRLALRTTEACRAFAAGDMRTAADVAHQARAGFFFGRSLATIVMLEADARAALGDAGRADSLYGMIAAAGWFDGDNETFTVLQPIAAGALQRRGTHRVATSVRLRQDPGRSAVFSDGHGVLEVRRQGAVLRHHGPFIV